MRLGQTRFLVLAIFASVLGITTPSNASHSVYHVVNSNWNLWWGFTDSDGLRIKDATFNGRRVFLSGMTIPQIIPKYAEGFEFIDQLGNGPISGGYVVPYVGGSAGVTTLPDGFEISALYSQWTGTPSACSYRYKVRYRFHVTGGFEPWLEIHGPGCSPNGAVYHVFWRIDFDIEDAAGDYFQRHLTGTSWSQPNDEHWYYDDGSHDPLGREWRNFQGSTGRSFYIRPYALDSADFYELHYVAGEGNTELSTPTYPSSVALHNHDATIQNNDDVDWYIARITYPPCPTYPLGCGLVIPGPFMDATGF